jgi:Fuc2NAc and GlcNAc transferase
MLLLGASLVSAALCLSIIGTALMRRFALARNLLDVPNSRSSHLIPVPRGGGVAIVVVFLCAVFVLLYMHLLDASLAASLLFGGGAIASIGFLDDRWKLSAKLRLAVHLGAAAFVVALLGALPEQFLALTGVGKVVIDTVLTVLVLVWATNLFNFMDGIDGIAASEAVFVAGAGALMNWLSDGAPGMTVGLLCIGAASLGFLIWNWPPARIFMGDAGSGFLGFILATFGLAAAQRCVVPIEVWPILSGVFVVDSTVTLARRLVGGGQWWNPHKTHAYQHAARRLNSHKKVTILVILVNGLWLLPWAYSACRFPHHAAACTVAALVPLAVAVWIAGAGKDTPVGPRGE